MAKFNQLTCLPFKGLTNLGWSCNTGCKERHDDRYNGC